MAITMQQPITKAAIEKLIDNNDLKLKATQPKLCLAIVNRIFQKMQIGIKFPPIKVYSGCICDGHHRFVAAVLANYEIESIPTQPTSATTTVPWHSVILDETDWDTLEDINLWNQQDAIYNNVPLEKIVELLP
jgi:hypothetical protein